MNNTPTPSPLELVQAMQDRTNQLVKAFQEMSKLQQSELHGTGNIDAALGALDEILAAEKRIKVLHSTIWGEIDKTAKVLRRRKTSLAMMLSQIQNKKRF